MSTPARAWETGQFALAVSACSAKAAASMPGTSAVVVSWMREMRKPPSPRSRWTRAEVSIEVGAWPARSSAPDSAMEKQPAWAAPMSSSGFVPVPSSKRDEKEYWPSNAPLPRRIVPLPPCRPPSQRAVAVRSGIGFLLGSERELSHELERFGLLAEHDHRGDAGFTPRVEPLGDTFPGADERDLVDELVRHRRRCFMLLAVQVEVLDLLGRGFVAETARQVVVEVPAAGTHPADVQRRHRLHEPAERVDVVADEHGDAGRDVEGGARLVVTRLGEAAVERGAVGLGEPVGREEDGKPSVGDLGGELDVL